MVWRCLKRLKRPFARYQRDSTGISPGQLTLGVYALHLSPLGVWWDCHQCLEHRTSWLSELALSLLALRASIKLLISTENFAKLVSSFLQICICCLHAKMQRRVRVCPLRFAGIWQHGEIQNSTGAAQSDSQSFWALRIEYNLYNRLSIWHELGFVLWDQVYGCLHCISIHKFLPCQFTAGISAGSEFPTMPTCCRLESICFCFCQVLCKSLTSEQPIEVGNWCDSMLSSWPHHAHHDCSGGKSQVGDWDSTWNWMLAVSKTQRLKIYGSRSISIMAGISS